MAIAIIPPSLFFLVMQRSFSHALTAGGFAANEQASPPFSRRPYNPVSTDSSLDSEADWPVRKTLLGVFA
jgi:hypothetical protein